MDVLKNKRYTQYDYRSRYTNIPYYYNSIDKKDIYGLGDNMLKNISFVSYKVTQEDTLDSLALKFYANPSLWWVIAYFNDINDSFMPLWPDITIIKIPDLSSIEFGELR